MVCEVGERDDPVFAADLVSRACLRELICKGRKQPIILHSDTGNAMRTATLESRLENLCVFRSFSRPRVSNDNPYSASLFRMVNYWHDYSRRPFASEKQACQRVAPFVDWYNHRHLHGGIKFVIPVQRHSGSAISICQQRTEDCEEGRRANPIRRSRHIPAGDNQKYCGSISQ